MNTSSTVKLKYLLAGNRGGVWGEDPLGNGDSVVLRSTEQSADGRWQINEPALRALTAAERRRFRLVTGDVLVTKSSGSATHIGKATLVDSSVAAIEPAYSNFMQRLRPGRALDPHFLWYLLQTNWSREQLALFSTTTTGLNNLTGNQLGLIEAPHVDIREQRAIADYLDRETAQIDAFIAKNEELITLLAERRAAVVVRSVSRGLRHGVIVKLSGTEWATDVPSHWQVGNIRRFASMRTGHTPSRQHPDYWVDCEIPWFTLADVWQLRQGVRDMGKTSEKISALGLANSAAELLPPGTVALSRTASVGFAGIMRVEMATSQDFWNFVPRKGLISEYLWYQFQAMKPEFERLMIGSTHRTIYQAAAASITVLVPPVSEQYEIVDWLDSVTKRIDDAIASAHSGVALARERRAALISAAITGKIDVAVAA